MKYQITCDNCGTQFIIDAEPGMTVECQCPECHGVMQITLPNAAKGEHYEAPDPRVAARRILGMLPRWTRTTAPTGAGCG